MMNRLELIKKAGQMMVVGFDGTSPSPEIKELIMKYHIGGVILFSRNIENSLQVLMLTTELQTLAKNAGYKQPLLICIDQENGIVRRLKTGSSIFPGSMLISATGNIENAYLVGAATGRELKTLGINWNLAPVVDVNNNPNNPVIGVRSYGENPFTVTEYARETIRGLHEAGVITALKHFPGHGDTDIDSHLDLPIIKHDIDRLEAVELVPFKKLIQEGADSIMTAHVYFPAIEKSPGIPATLSRAVVTGLLRERIGYQGVVVSDCMEMNAIKNTIGTINGSVEAVKAGVDLVMVSHTFELQKGSIEAIADAVLQGELEEADIDKAIIRIVKLKDKYLHWKNSICVLNEWEDPLQSNHEDNKRLAQDIYRKGITLYKNKNSIIPMDSGSDNKVLVIYPKNQNMALVEDLEHSNSSLGNAVKEIAPFVEMETMQAPLQVDAMNHLLTKAQKFDTIIIGTMSLKKEAMETCLINSLVSMQKHVIAVAMRSPYDIKYIPDVDAYIAAYEYTYPALCMAAKVIFGMEKAGGVMPVTIQMEIKQ